MSDERQILISNTLQTLRSALPPELAARLPSGAGDPWAPPSLEGGLARFIDHTLLKADARVAQLEALAEEARAHRFASVCVNGAHVPRMKGLLEGSGVPVCAVVGFPLGAMAPAAKAFEARQVVEAGAGEVDMVVAIGALKDGQYVEVYEDIAGVVACGAPVKVILETCLLDDAQKIIACALSVAAGAAFVKTSTGFGGGGATEADVALMRAVVGAGTGVKASGGVRDADAARRMIAAGASRMGASASVAIVSAS